MKRKKKKMEKMKKKEDEEEKKTKSELVREKNMEVVPCTGKEASYPLVSSKKEK